MANRGDDHKLLTAEKLAELQAQVDDNMADAEVGPLLTEVKRLREPMEAIGLWCPNCEADVGLDCPTCAEITQPVLRKAGRYMDCAPRTLTLPNGVEVRAGNVLADPTCRCDGEDPPYDPDRLSAVKVTAVGENAILGWHFTCDDTEDGYAEEGNGEWKLCWWHEEEEVVWQVEQLADWRPWSEVHPDRPVPEEED